MIGYNTVRVLKRKRLLKIGSSPRGNSREVIRVTNALLEEQVHFIPAENLLETGLENPAQIARSLPALLNYERSKRTRKPSAITSKGSPPSSLKR